MPPKKRGRKPKKTKEPKNDVKKVHKKRGRKPKGGKIITLYLINDFIKFKIIS